MSTVAIPTQTSQEHLWRHIELHRMLDELVADYIAHTGKTPSETTVIELMQWSTQQTMTPTETTVIELMQWSTQQTMTPTETTR